MSDAYEQMKQFRDRQQRERASADAAKQTEADEQKQKLQRRMQQILNELVDILVAEKIPPRAVYDYKGTKHAILSGKSHKVYSDTGDSAWDLLAHWPDPESGGWCPVVNVDRQLLSAMHVRPSTDPRDGAPRGMSRGPGFWGSRTSELVIEHSPPGGVWQPRRIDQMQGDALLAFYMAVVDSNRSAANNLGLL